MTEAIAYHEAGHAVMCLEMGSKFRYVDIIPKDEDNSLGRVKLSQLRLTKLDLPYFKRRMEAEKYLSMALAGVVAEGLFFNKPKDAGGNDYQQCFVVALYIFGQDNIKVAEAYINFVITLTRTKLSGRKPEIRKLAKALLKQKKLKYKEVLEILPYYK